MQRANRPLPQAATDHDIRSNNTSAKLSTRSTASNACSGKGGMGAVYLATHLGTERYVALKLIAPQFMRNEEFVERFKREARAAGRLRHPNVVDVTDFGFSRRPATIASLIW